MSLAQFTEHKPVRTSRASTTRRCWRLVAGSILTFLAVLAASMTAPQSASASAPTRHGCTTFGPGFDVHGIGVKDGSECVFVTGRGLYVQDAYVYFLTTTTKVCNWWIDIDTPAQQPALRHFQGAFHNGCAKWSGVLHAPVRPGAANPGRVCATLFENAIVRAKSCLTIHT